MRRAADRRAADDGAVGVGGRADEPAERVVLALLGHPGLGHLRVPHGLARSRGRPRSRWRPCCRGRRRPGRRPRTGSARRRSRGRRGSARGAGRSTPARRCRGRAPAAPRRRRPSPRRVVQFPVPTNTSRRSRSTVGDPHTSPQPAPVAPSPDVGRGRGLPPAGAGGGVEGDDARRLAVGRVVDVGADDHEAVDDRRRALDLGGVVVALGPAEVALPAHLAVVGPQGVQRLAARDVDGAGAADVGDRGRRRRSARRTPGRGARRVNDQSSSPLSRSMA